jgi:hypothetical protein
VFDPASSATAVVVIAALAGAASMPMIPASRRLVKTKKLTIRRAALDPVFAK